MVSSWAVFADLSWEECFSGFSGDTVWLLMGVFLVAYALEQTGLLKRITHKVMGAFKPTYNGQILALLVSGSLVAPLVPSTMAKTVFGGSVSRRIADEMGYESCSRGRTGLFLAGFSGYGATVPAFLSASALTYMMRGLLPAEYAAEVTWLSWATAMFPWLIIFVVLTYLAITLLYRPKGEEAESLAPISSKEERPAPMSKAERTVAVIGLSCMALWAAESVVGIPSAAVALLGAAALFLTGVLSPADFSKAVPWGLFVFVGCVLGLGKRFTDMGLSALLTSVLAPVIGLASTAPMAVVLLYLTVALSTFVIASQAVPIAVFMAIMPGLLAPLGFSPFIVGVMILMACNCYFVNYQNLSYIAVLEHTKGAVRQKDVLPAALSHVVISITGCLLCLPYWAFLGYVTL